MPRSMTERAGMSTAKEGNRAKSLVDAYAIMLPILDKLDMGTSFERRRLDCKTSYEKSPAG